MRILWLSMTASLYDTAKIVSGYNGCGWISSLQEAISQKSSDIQFGIAFLYPTQEAKLEKGNTTYYPIYNPPKKAFHKIYHYWRGYRKENNDYLIPRIQEIIENFKPDIIHLFGTESPLAIIAGNTATPVIAHLQGLLNPITKSFYPIGMNHYSFLFKHFSINEWILKNGYIFAERSIKVRSKQELKTLKKLEYVMGRTEWDKQVSKLLAPQAKYFHVDEVLRKDFYQRTWRIPSEKTFIITSTISKTVYKGLDLILRTAQLLMQHSNINFEWRVVGINKDDKFTKLFEKNYNIKSDSVNVRYMGIMDAASLCENLLQSHIYVHPSYIDNSPNSVCEAQLLGMPVIATNVGGISSLIEIGKDGILVPSNAPYELAFHIQNLCGDKSQMTFLGENAQKTATERHSKDKIVNDLLTTYSYIIKSIQY